MFEFSKRERLVSHGETERLFQKGEKFMAYPFSVRYMSLAAEAGNISVLLTSPKRYQKHSVCRNRVKRLLRESYRLNSRSLKDFVKNNPQRLVISVSLVSKQLPTYSLTEHKMKEILSALEERLNEKPVEKNS